MAAPALPEPAPAPLNSTPLSTITRRPHLSTISIRPDNDGKLLVEGALLISTGANVVASSPSKSRPSRASRHHVNNWLTDRLYRRAVAETCRRPAWLSATIRCFSANVQRRRAPVEITSRRETFELGVWSVIRLCLHPHAASRKTVLGGGIPWSSILGGPKRTHDGVVIALRSNVRLRSLRTHLPQRRDRPPCRSPSMLVIARLSPGRQQVPASLARWCAI